MIRSATFAFSITLTLAALAWWASPARADWPQWRGPLANGVATGATPPTEWSETKNVKWKVKIPGSGTSTPIMLGDKVYLTTAVATGKKSAPPVLDPSLKQADTPPPAPPPGGPGEERRERRREGGGPPGGPPGGGGGGRGRGLAPDEAYQFQLHCLDRGTGKTLWQETAIEQLPHEGHHQDHGYASHSPVTDGTHVYAYFGSRGLHCYTLEGRLVWSKSLGRMQTRNGFGEGSSPLLTGDAIVINWDHEGADFIVCLDKKTGAERWRKERDEPTSWATPLAVEHDGKTQIVVSATNRIRSYDLATGDQIWECGGMTTNAIPTPLTGHGMLYAISGFRGNAVLAIRLGRTGDLTDTDAIAWKYETKAPYVPSGLLEGDRLWFFSQNTGILSCLDAKTGKVLVDAERVEGLGGVYASPVIADGKIYLTGRNGEGVVLRAGPKLEILASNQLDEKFEASPALSGKDLLLRGHEFLYCLSNP
jgi:outer membrane protein assembly factor BamB